MERTAVNPWDWSIKLGYNQAEVIDGATRQVIWGRLRESVKSYAKRRAAVSHSRAGFPLGRHTDRALPV